MSNAAKQKRDARIRRHARVRKHVRGTAERPRLAVFRSNRHISAQVIDDRTGKTLASASTHEADMRAGSSNKDAAAKVGRRVAERAKDAGIERVVCEGGGSPSPGGGAAVADAAREAGLEF
jgi:large subunit ribosomal protein L18